jgi:hypothetical protein
MRRLLPLWIIALLTLTGCAVLTPSQRSEVEKFGKATAAYSAFPSEVMVAHAELHANVKLANASTAFTGENALRLLDKAGRFRGAVEKKARRAKSACSVLKRYGDLLTALTADTHAPRLQSSAETAGGALDNAIEEYNNLSNSSVSLFGNAAAAAVRGAGGLYIKRRQSVALRQAVRDGKPAVAEMARAVSDLLDLYYDEDPEAGLNLIASTRDELRKWYQLVGYKDRLPAARAVFHHLQKAEAAEKLARKARAGIETLVAAHENLYDKVNERATLAYAIETVQVFADEVNAAKDLYEQLSD